MMDASLRADVSYFLTREEGKRGSARRLDGRTRLFLKFFTTFINIIVNHVIIMAITILYFNFSLSLKLILNLTLVVGYLKCNALSISLKGKRTR